jgi:hypothetical protein
LTNLTHPSSLRPAAAKAGTHLRGSLKGALALLALVLLGLLLWQLFTQFRHTQADLRQQSLTTSAELADHLSLNMALKAQQALNLVQPYVKTRRPPPCRPCSKPCRRACPPCSMAWLDSNGQTLADTLAGSDDRPLIDELLQLNQGRAFFYTTARQHTVYLLLRQPAEQDRGYWLLRLSPTTTGAGPTPGWPRPPVVAAGKQPQRRGDRAPRPDHHQRRAAAERDAGLHRQQQLAAARPVRRRPGASCCRR